jgi:hypothetical protein
MAKPPPLADQSTRPAAAHEECAALPRTFTTKWRPHPRRKAELSGGTSYFFFLSARFSFSVFWGAFFWSFFCFDAPFIRTSYHAR